MRALLTLLTLNLAVLAGCAPPMAPLSHTRGSAAEVAEAVLTAFAARDLTALTDLALSEREFRDHVWPSLPSARPERNLPFSYVWGDLRQKSELSLRTNLAKHGGVARRLKEVRFGERTPYAGFTVHRESTFVVEGPDGETELRLCGSMLEEGGRWKVFSYVVD